MIGSIIAIVLALIIGGVAIMFLLYNMRAHKLVLRIPTKEGSYVEDIYKMVPKIDKGSKATWWITVPWQRRLKLLQPPEEARTISKKGRFFVEAYQLNEDQFVYVKDTGLDKKSKLDNGTLIENLKPFSAVARSVIVEQFARAEKSRQKSFLKENGLTLAFGFMMLMIIVLFFVYFGELSAAINSSIDSSRGLVESVTKMLGSFTDGAKDLVPAGGASAIITGGETPPTR